MFDTDINIFCGNTVASCSWKIFFPIPDHLAVVAGIWYVVFCPTHTPCFTLAFPLQLKCVSPSVFQQAHYLNHQLPRLSKKLYSAFLISCKIQIYRLFCPTALYSFVFLTLFPSVCISADTFLIYLCVSWKSKKTVRTWQERNNYLHSVNEHGITNKCPISLHFCVSQAKGFK